MRYLSVCSGIEAATAAWHSLGWSAAAFSEIEAFPSAVLAHHYSSNMPGQNWRGRNGVPNLGDFTGINPAQWSDVDLLVGGTPCQAFSVAGARRSLADARGNLTLAFVELAHALRSLRWVVWENVPGVLSTKDNAFGCFLGGLVGSDAPLPGGRGGKWPNAGLVSGPLGKAAWRVLDAQFFGVPQRRRRVFVVASLGAGGDPAAVLFEREGVCRNPAPRRETREDVAGTLSARTQGGGGLGTDFELGGGLIPSVDVARCLTSRHGSRLDFETETFVAFQEQGSNVGVLGSITGTLPAGNGNQSGGVPCIAFSCKDHGADAGSTAPTLRAMGHSGSHANAGGQLAVAFSLRGRDGGAMPEIERGGVAPALRASEGGSTRPFVAASTVRRLTPRECERLQGFPDDYTMIPMDRVTRSKVEDDFAAYLRASYPDITLDEIKRLAADGPRYKALGNSMAVPVMRWIGERIQLHEQGKL